MRLVLFLLLLAACTVPPGVPVKEPPRDVGTGMAEVLPAPPPEAPPKPPPKRANGVTIKATPLPPEPPPLPPCPPLSENKKIQILQKLDCLIIIEQVKPKP